MYISQAEDVDIVAAPGTILTDGLSGLSSLDGSSRHSLAALEEVLSVDMEQEPVDVSAGDVTVESILVPDVKKGFDSGPDGSFGVGGDSHMIGGDAPALILTSPSKSRDDVFVEDDFFTEQRVGEDVTESVYDNYLTMYEKANREAMVVSKDHSLLIITKSESPGDGRARAVFTLDSNKQLVKGASIVRIP